MDDVFDLEFTAEEIEARLRKAHEHANMATLNKFGESGGKPTFNGNPIEGASDAFEIAFGDTTVGDALEELLYVPLSVNITGGGTYEIGQTVQSVVLNWTYNKPEIVSQSMNHSIGTLSPALRTYTHYGQTITANRTYTIVGNDGRQGASDSTTVAFSHKRYWGVSPNATLTDAQIIALSSEFSSSRAQTRTFDATGGRYFYFAYPAAWGAASFKVGGLAFSDVVLVTRNFVNASGNTTSFNIYRSGLIQTGPAILAEVS